MISNEIYKAEKPWGPLKKGDEIFLMPSTPNYFSNEKNTIIPIHEDMVNHLLKEGILVEKVTDLKALADKLNIDKNDLAKALTILGLILTNTGKKALFQ